ncbi:hypothetical protein ACFJIV_16010 [Mucilaginibacter sp. UC70_90]
MKKVILSLLLLAAVVICKAQPVARVYKEITVAQDGSGDFKSIQEAVKRSS